MDFDASYEGTPPWDIGRAQPELVALAERGAIHGSVLDVGCGTGENSLEFARCGHEVWGIDSSPRAIAKATAKASHWELTIHFAVHDALHLESLGRTFDTVVDSGLFHVFDDEDRARYVASLAKVLRSGGRYYTLVFSDAEPNWGGPRRILRTEFAEAFGTGWTVEEIRPATFQTLPGTSTGKAWLATIVRA